MKQTDQQKRQLPVAASNRARTWLVGCMATMVFLMAAAILLVPRFIDFPLIKQQIQTAVLEQTGGQIDYQGIDLSFFPRLSIELRQVSLAISHLEGSVAALRISPELLPLLTGKLRLAGLELETPSLNLQLPDRIPQEPADLTLPLSEMGKSLTMTTAPFNQAIDGLEMQVSDARLSVARGKGKFIEIEGLSLKSGISIGNPGSARANLQAKCSELNIHRNGQAESIKDLSLSVDFQMADDRMTVKLDQLVLAEPDLELTGNLTLAPTSPAITLNLYGAGIDVDATRDSALTLAGETGPIEDIFDYLRGGRVPQISFYSHGDTLADLGNLSNILIKGRLQDGRISVPEIKLDLAEVSGDVVISKGVLQGTGLSTRLETSTGRDGSLQIGLTDENDVFQLDLLLKADLAETRSVLQRVLDAPSFTAELEKFTNLQGTCQGKLTLGDSLHDIKAKINVSELKLAADYQRVPLPIAITQGQFTFIKNQLDLKKFSGSLGKSQFADLSGQFLWKTDLSLDIISGRFDLDMTELYPWLASLEGLRDKLGEIKQVTGGVALANLALKGKVARPSAWQITTTGTVKDLSVSTEALPEKISITDGGFAFDSQQMTFKKIRTSNQDAALVISGTLHGFPQQIEKIELSMGGSMGPKSVTWLSEKLNVPESYAIHAPLSISNAQFSWQPDSTTSFKGLVSIDKGPAITADIEYLPEHLQVKQLHIKDQYSDAGLVYSLREEQHDFGFTGHLQHETLQNVFIDNHFSSGRLEGDFTVSVPQDERTKVTTTGQLTGEKLPVPLPSGDILDIDQVTLKADGPQIKVDITKFTWQSFTWEPVKGTVSLSRGRADIRLSNARLCGINSPGVLSVIGDEFSLDMNLHGKDLDVATSYTCLTDGRVKATGSLDFSSRITAKGKMGQMIESLKGPLEMTLSNGVIEHDKLVTRTLAVINVTEIVKGRLPDIRSKGFAFTTMTLQGYFKNGKLIIEKYYMDGETLDLLGYGEIDLDEKTLEAQVLAAPFKTVDRIVKIIPGVNYLLAGSLVAIPVSIKGPQDDPKVNVMSVSAVSSSLYNLAERTITSPFKLIEKINPWKKRNNE